MIYGKYGLNWKQIACLRWIIFSAQKLNKTKTILEITATLIYVYAYIAYIFWLYKRGI